VLRNQKTAGSAKQILVPTKNSFPGHDRRRPIHYAIAPHPTAEWTARQVLVAFPWDSAPRYLLRGRDLDTSRSSPRLPNGWALRKFKPRLGALGKTLYVERLIGSFIANAWDHVIVFDEAGLRRILKDYGLCAYQKLRLILQGLRPAECNSFAAR